MLLLILVTLLVVTLLAVGVTLSIVDVDRYNFALYLILLGIVSLCVVVALWIVRPSALMKWPRFCQRLCPVCFGPKKYRVPESKVILGPTDAEAVMKNIRGIPYLMQVNKFLRLSRPPMLYACLGVCFCVSVGLTGLMLSIIDIERYNFGLYLTLLAVVGTTIAIAFWIVKPEMCSSPEWFDRAATVLSIQMSTTFGKKKRRTRSAKSNRSASSMPTTSFRRHSTKRRRPIAEVGEEAQRRSHSAQPPHALNSAPLAAPVCRRSSSVARIQLTSNDENSAAIATNSVHTEMSPLLNNYLGKKRSSTRYSLYKKTAGDDSAFHDSPASSLSHAPCSCLFPMELHEQASQTEITATASQKLLLISGCEDEGMISSSREQSSMAHMPRSASDNLTKTHSPFRSSYLPIDSDHLYRSDKDSEPLSLPKLKAQPAAKKYSLSRLFVSKLSTDGAKRVRSSSSDWLPSWRPRGSSPVEYDTEEISYV